jgi:hypothetical protein
MLYYEEQTIKHFCRWYLVNKYRILNRDTNDDSEYLIGLEPKIVRLLSLIQDYKVAIQDYKDIQKYGEELERHKKVLEQSKELDENNKRLRHVLESCLRI